jgi:hypothetical protein
MKLTKMLLLAGTMTLLTHSAFATTDQITFTATVRSQETNAGAKTTETSKTATVAWNNAKLYVLISNAVAHIGTNGTGIAPANVPANGYIAFNPNGTDGNVYGTFYITNKTGFSYPLSGLDTNGNYYSLIELDTYLATTDNTKSPTNTITAAPGPGLVNFGFSDNFNGIETGVFSTTTGGGSESAVSTALFYVHDNPYSYNGGNNANVFYDNGNAYEIRGLADIVLSYKTNEVLHWTISLTGTGNAVVTNSQNAIVTTGHFSVSQ